MATALGAVAVAECRKNGADAALMVPMPPRDADRRTLCTTTKLHAHSAGLFRVLSRIGILANVVDIPPSWGIRSTFNVTDLVSHQALPPSSDVQPSPTDPFSEREFALESTPLVLPLNWHERVEEILREGINFLGDGASRRFLVNWQGKPVADDVWIMEADLVRL